MARMWMRCPGLSSLSRSLAVVTRPFPSMANWPSGSVYRSIAYLYSKTHYAFHTCNSNLYKCVLFDALVQSWRSNKKPIHGSYIISQQHTVILTRIWANAQHDGRPAEYRWSPLFNAQCRKVWLTPTTTVLCSNAAKTRNLLKLAGVPQTTRPISAVSGPKFTILWGHVKEISLLNKFFPIVDTCLSCEDITRQSCAVVPRWRFF